MNESEMGYRGSKSTFFNVIFSGAAILNNCKLNVVKEQRLDGGYVGLLNPALRYSLMGLERGYQVKTLSKQISNISYRMYSTDIKPELQPSNLNSWFISGFCDGEACFYVGVQKNNKSKLGWNVELIFTITLHSKDKRLLEQINNYFGVGYLTNHGNNSLQYRVKSIKDLKFIIEHFERYPLITKKLEDYLLFKKVFYLVTTKEHLKLEGLKKIVSIRATLNRGANDKIKEAFADEVLLIENSKASVTDIKVIPDPNWLAGFASAESCFLINIKKSLSHNCGYQVWLIFTLTQHKRDESLMKSFESYLGCGTLETTSREVVNFNVRKLSDIINIIIPFFSEHPIIGEKLKDYNDWCKVASLMSEGKHLTLLGIEEIQKIKGGMNTKREN